MAGVLFFLFIMAFVAIAVFGWLAAARRSKELAAWAAAHGLRYSPGRDGSLETVFPDFPCLRQGYNRYASNVMSGDWAGRPFCAFEYHYTTGSGRHKRHHRLSAAAMAGDVPLKPLHIRPEGLFDKVAGFFGFEDINFESAEFSRRFFVKAPNKRWAYDVIHPRAMEFLMANPPFSIQFGLRRVICYRDRQFAPEDFEAACQVVAGLLDRLPEYVMRQQGSLGRSGQGEA